MGNAEFGDFSLLFESVDFLLAFAREVDPGLSILDVAGSDFDRTDDCIYYCIV